MPIRSSASWTCRQIETADVLAVLRPIWTTKTETASRVRQRIEAVLDYATAIGKRTGDNPARWKGHLDHLLPKPSKVRAVEHHAALDWREAPAFMAELASREGIGAKALAFAILTAARSGEVRGMTWGEVDDARRRLDRARRPHEGRQGASRAADGRRAGAAGRAGRARCAGVPEPERSGTRPLSDMTLTAVLRRMGRGDLTVHGFRSTFRDWAGETTAHPREVIEARAGASAQGQGRGGLCPRRPVREAAQAHGGLGGVPRQGSSRGGRDASSGRWSGGVSHAHPQLRNHVSSICKKSNVARIRKGV